MDWNFLLPLLGGAVGAAIVNGAFAFFKQKSDVSLEHERWQRDQRRVEYGKYLQAVTDYTSVLHRSAAGALVGQEAADQLLATQDAFLKAGSQLQLTSPPELVRCSTKVKDAISEMVRAFAGQVAVEESGAITPEWEAAMGSHTRAMTDFMILARHDIGMMEDNLTKTRAAIENGLQVIRQAQSEGTLRDT